MCNILLDCAFQRNDMRAFRTRATQQSPNVTEQLQHDIFTNRVLSFADYGLPTATDDVLLREWREVLTTYRNVSRLDTDSGLVVHFFDEALEHDPLPTVEEFEAMKEFLMECRGVNDLLDTFYSAQSSRLSRPVSEITEIFEEAYLDSYDNPEQPTQGQTLRAANLDLDTTQHTIIAVNKILDMRVEVATIAMPELLVSPHHLVPSSEAIKSMGYNAVDGLLEVLFSDHRVNTYKNVSEALWSRMMPGNESTLDTTAIFMADIATNSDCWTEDLTEMMNENENSTIRFNVLDMVDITQYENPFDSNERSYPHITRLRTWTYRDLKAKTTEENFAQYAHLFNEAMFSSSGALIAQNTSIYVVYFMKWNNVNRGSAHIVDVITDDSSIAYKTFDNNRKVEIVKSKPLRQEPFVAYTEEESEHARQRYSAMVESGVPLLDLRASYTRAITLDTHHRKNPYVLLPSKTDFKAALRNHDKFYVPFKVRCDAEMMQVQIENPVNQAHYSRPAPLDDDGFSNRLNNSPGQYTTSFILVEKTGEGEFTTSVDTRLTQCGCAVSRMRKACQHGATLARKHNTVTDYLNNVIRGARNSTPTIDLSTVENGQYLTTTLARRNDLVVEPPTEEGGKPLYVFQQRDGNGGNRYCTSIKEITKGIIFRNLDFSQMETFEQYLEAAEVYMTDLNLTSVSLPRNLGGVRQALRRGPVSIPVVLSYRRSWAGPIVSGRIVYGLSDEGNITITNATLTCDTCNPDDSTAECKEIRDALLKAPYLLNAGQRDFIPFDQTEADMEQSNQIRAAVNPNYTQMQRLTPQMSEFRQLHVISQNTGETDITVLRTIRDDRQVRERLARERREERDRQVRRNNALMYSRQNAQQVQEWKTYNPAIAGGLEEYRSAMVEKWQTIDAPYEGSLELLEGIISNAMAAQENGTSPLMFRAGSVLDGITEGNGGRKFGIELEFVVKDGLPVDETIRKIGRALFDAGLTQFPEQDRYHAALRNGYHGWSFERDSTVHGELVSPLLDDTEASWEQVRKACTIITENGGTSTIQTGSHVHVSTGSYEMSAAKRAEMIRFASMYQDVIYRLASHPERKKHRGTRWCRPNGHDNAGELALNAETEQAGHNLFSGGHTSHDVAINMAAMGTQLSHSHVEFRMWDGTLDPAIVQAQVMVSAAITDYAERNVVTNGKSDALDVSTVKAIGHSKSGAKSNHDVSGEEGLASFLDKLFRKNEDKEQVAKLFAVTEWQEPSIALFA